MKENEQLFKYIEEQKQEVERLQDQLRDKEDRLRMEEQRRTDQEEEIAAKEEKKEAEIEAKKHIVSLLDSKVFLSVSYNRSLMVFPSFWIKRI